MSEEIKDREERFKNNDLWNHGGLALENAYQSAPRDTSIEAMEEWRKEENYRKEAQHFTKTHRLARPEVSYIAKYDLPDLDMPDELIKALKNNMPQYQVKNYWEEFKRCKDACRLTIDQFEKWLLQINEADRLDIYEVCITFEPHTGGSKSSWLHGTQMERFKKETADKKMVVEEAEKYCDKLIPAFEQELKNRENSEKVKELIAEANKLVKGHKQLAQKVSKALMEFGETQSFKTAKTFIEEREKMRIIEGEIYTLSRKFDLYEAVPETKLPTLANEVTTNELQSSQYSTKGALIGKIETFYKKEIEKREASKKA